MKKIFKLIFIITILFSFSHFSYATSGACSDHAGVNCYAGASSSGRAICNDGTESSVSYSAMQECSYLQIYTPVYAPNICSSAYVIQEYSEYLAQPQLRQQIKSDVQTGIQQENTKLNSTTNTLKNTLDSEIQSENNMWNPLIQSETNDKNQYHTTSYDSLIQNATDARDGAITNYQNQYQTQVNNLVSPINTCLNSLNKLSSDIDSADRYCTMTYGSDAVPNTGLFDCKCADGYSMNSDKNFCYPTPKPLPVQTVSTPPTEVQTPTQTVAPQPVATPTPTVQTVKTPKAKPVKQTISTPVPQKNISQPSGVIGGSYSDNSIPLNTQPVVAPTPTSQKEGFFKRVWHFFTNLF